MEKVKVSIELIKELRAKTGVGLNYCREALEESNLDINQALSYLRKKGLEKAITREAKVAKEGLVAACVAEDSRSGAVVEVNSETDFVSSNNVFINFAKKAAHSALENEGNLVALQENLADEQGQITLQVGEKIEVSRASYFSESDGWVVSYLHRRLNPEVGRVGVLLTYQGPEPSQPEIAELLKQIMMQIVAMDPIAVSIADLDPALVAQQRNQIKETLVNVDKPIQIIDRMVEGKLRKYYETVVLLEQSLAFEPQKRVKDLLVEIDKKLIIKNFVRFEVSK